MERKVGEIFTTKDGVKLKVEESPRCDDCHFNKMDGCSALGYETGACFSLARKDNKSIIFKRI